MPSKADSWPNNLLSSIEAVDLHTLRLILTRPDAAFLYKLAFPLFGPHSPANVKSCSGGDNLIRYPSGTGSFHFIQ